jgi:hypothetical protein
VAGLSALASLIDRLEAELAEAKTAGEPDDWRIPISKLDIREIINHLRANLAIENIKKMDEPWDGIPGALLYRESGNG